MVEKGKETAGRLVMTKPLPEILDYLEAAIAKAEQAELDAHEAAREAREAGLNAGLAAKAAAAEAVAVLQKETQEGLAAINGRIDAIVQAMFIAGTALQQPKGNK
jgi:flagellar biosynthesis/type III secretory pathway protein FliH